MAPHTPTGRHDGAPPHRGDANRLGVRFHIRRECSGRRFLRPPLAKNVQTASVGAVVGREAAGSHLRKLAHAAAHRREHPTKAVSDRVRSNCEQSEPRSDDIAFGCLTAPVADSAPEAESHRYSSMARCRRQECRRSQSQACIGVLPPDSEAAPGFSVRTRICRWALRAMGCRCGGRLGLWR